MESKTNITSIPLNAGAIFIGTYEDVSPYVSAVISVNADTEVVITAYQSLNKQRTTTTIFNYDDVNNIQTFIISPLTQPYIYFVVQNSTLTNQTYLNFSVKYVSTTVSTGTGNNVNITNTSLPCAQYGTWSLSVDNFPASTTITNTVDVSDLTTHTKLDSVITDLDKFKFNADNLKVEVQNASLSVSDTNLYNLLNTKGTLQLYDNSILAGGTTASLNLSSKKVSNLTFYGSQNSNGNVLTVQFSNNGSNWYDSQYNYTFASSSSGSFGWAIQACPYYVRVKSANACNLTIQCDYC